MALTRGRAMGYLIPPMPIKVKAKVVCAYCGTSATPAQKECDSCGGRDIKITWDDPRQVPPMTNVQALPL